MSRKGHGQKGSTSKKGAWIRRGQIWWGGRPPLGSRYSMNLPGARPSSCEYHTEDRVGGCCREWEAAVALWCVSQACAGQIQYRP